MTVRSASFPFLAIAKAYQVDYGDVLTLADAFRDRVPFRAVQAFRSATVALGGGRAWDHLAQEVYDACVEHPV